MDLTIASRVRLNNGVEIPYLGLGTYLITPGRLTQAAVTHALLAGYRHIDTAKIYRNERDIGIAVREVGVPREEVFIATKLWNIDQGYEKTKQALQQSLRQLDMDYVDLFLMHWPVTDHRLESWRAMEELLDEGQCRAIGVSNFTIKHLEELLENCTVVPALNQVEFHPWLYQKELLTFCQSQGIQLGSFSPLTKGRRLNDSVITTIAERYNKTSAQILIRWALEHRLVVIPKSGNRERIRENADIFNFFITPEDMTILNVLNENLRTAPDPTFEV
jgi:diketogulonate reductase-like aldo/keto reductase